MGNYAYLRSRIVENMKSLNPVWKFLGHNKYWIVSFVAVLIIGFIDENSVLKHVQNRLLVNELNEQINEYNKQYERDEAKLHELKSNPHAITKIARENYFMKADDEDIFVLSDDGPTANDNDGKTE